MVRQMDNEKLDYWGGPTWRQLAGSQAGVVRRGQVEEAPGRAWGSPAGGRDRARGTS